MADVTCAPICTVNTAGSLPTAAPAPAVVTWLLMCDDTLNDGTAIVEYLQQTSTQDGVVTVTDFAADGTTPYTPLGTTGLCTTATCETNELKTVCMVDDVAGDQTGALVGYVELYCINVDASGNVSSTLLGTYTDSTVAVPYTPVGVATDPSAIGSTPVIKQGRTGIAGAGGTWSPSGAATGYTIRVVAGTPAFTDSFGNTSALVTGEVLSFTSESNSMLLDTAPTLTTALGDSAVITFTEIGA